MYIHVGETLNTQRAYSHVQETLNHKYLHNDRYIFTHRDKHVEERLVHKTSIHACRKHSNVWTHTHTHTGSELMRPDDDKCSITKSNSSIISFLRFTANIRGPLAPSVYGRVANRVARLVGGNGQKTHTVCGTHTHTLKQL